MDVGFFHPERGYWQAIDISTEPFEVIVEPERVEFDDEGNETVIPAITRETTQLAELVATYPDGTVQVPLKPGANFEWQNGAWTEIEPSVPPAPDRVSRRQFGMQLIISGWRTAADAWVAQQDESTRWAYENSDTFVRDDPMLQAGFAALGVNEQQVDEFFAAAAAL